MTMAIAFDDALHPPTGGWTVDDLDELPLDGVRRELIDGVLHVMPSPGRIHQTVAMRLGTALDDRCPPDYDVTQAVEVVFNRRNSRIPDVMVTTASAAAEREANPSKYRPQDIVLAVEIVSPSTVSQDRVAKPAQYAAAGIPLYWRIDIADGITVNTFQLNASAGVYTPSGEFTDVIRVDEPWLIELAISEITPRKLG